MKRKARSYWVAAVSLAALFQVSAFGADTSSAAIIVSNRAGEPLNEKIPVLEDLLTAQVTDLGISVVSPEVVIGAAKRFNADTASDGAQPDSLEALLSDQSSALRLAQGMGTDYVLSASISSFSERRKTIQAYGNTLDNYVYTMRVAYKIVDAVSGGSVTAGVAKASHTEQVTDHAVETAESFSAESSARSAPARVASKSNSYAMSGGTADDGLVNVVRQYESAVGLVVDTQRGEPAGFGTAWAIGPSTFATNAHISQPVAELMAKGGAAYIILNKNPEKRFRITQAITHPQYGKAGRNFDGRDAAAPTYDVGILKIDGQTDVWFPRASAQTLGQLDSGYRIAYLGFPMEGLQGGGVDPRNPVATMQSGIITSNTNWWLGQAEYPDRLLVQHNLGATGGASGSPIFNPQGEVVALLNAGNITMTVQVDANGNPYVHRIPSAAMVNFGQRVDLLNDLLGNQTAMSSGPTFASLRDEKPVAVSKVSQPVVVAPGLNALTSDVVDSLLDEITQEISQQLKTKLANRPLGKTAEEDAYVTLEIDVETADLYVPDVRVGPENTVTVKDGKLAASPLNVTVEVDGVAVGTAPGKVEVRPGFSQLRLTRDGYKDWARTINARDGQKISVAMELSESGLARWQELTVFMNELKDGAKLTDAQIKEIEARAKMLSQSGYKVDIKVDTTEGITIEENRSIFGWE